jgi:uncharacterized LabA/DUF88 family protein
MASFSNSILMANKIITTGRKPSMVRMLAELIKGKRVMVFIDGSNLYYMMYQTKTRFSYETFETWLQSKCKLEAIHYYTAFDPEEDKQTDFLTDLEGLKYTIHKKPIKWVKDHHKGNMDVELAVDAISLAPQYDLMFLISGDGDFSYLCKALEIMGKKTIVASLGGYTAPELHESADNYFFLERISTVWKPQRNKARSTSQESPVTESKAHEDKIHTTPKDSPKKRQKSDSRKITSSNNNNHGDQGDLPKIFV